MRVHDIQTEEAQGVPHHLVGILSPNEPYTVQDFVRSASNIIDDIHRRNKIPIIAGGTLYYSESLLFKNFCSQNAMRLNQNNHTQSTIKQIEIEQKLDKIPDDEVWDELNKIDPIMANFYHQNNHRRIRRSLEVFYESGQCHSTLIKQHGGKWSDLRFDPLIIWLDADINIIDERINKRLDSMQSMGIFEEMEALYEYFLEHYDHDALDSSINDTQTEEKPPYISIAHGFGFQAFIPWLRAKYLDCITDKDSIARIKRECIYKYGVDTRRYARKQRRWLKNRISRPALLLPIYRFDTSDKDKWNENVLSVATQIVCDFLEDKPVNDKVLEHMESVNRLGNLKDMQRSIEIKSVVEWKNYECDPCEKVLHGELEYNEHMKSKKHQKRLRTMRRKQINNFLRYENYLNTEWREMKSF